MRALQQLFLVGILGLTLIAPANAAVIGTYTHDYGKGSKRVAPLEYDKLRGKHVEVRNSSSGETRFRDSIDISAVGPTATIDSIELELVFDRAGPNPEISENWYASISGAGAGSGQNTYALLNDAFSPQTILLLPGTDAFAAAVAGLSVQFTFIEPGTGRSDTFRLYSATIRVNGSLVAAVPLPAPGLLLLVALGGLAFARRKSTPQT